MELTDTFTLINPGCGCEKFAVPESTYNRWRRTHEGWHCPYCGDGRYFSGLSDEEKRIRKLEKDLSQTQMRAIDAESRASSTKRKYDRIRDRVKNGVCPCCNRTFDNLARHMATKHPEFGKRGTFKHIRLAFGLTQAEVAVEIGLSPSTISKYECGAFVGHQPRHLIYSWLQEAKA